MALQEHGDADFGGFEIVRWPTAKRGDQYAYAHPDGEGEIRFSWWFCVTLFSHGASFSDDDSGSGIVTSLLSWMVSPQLCSIPTYLVYFSFR